MHRFWPILLIVLSNTMYQVSAKSVPGTMNPFASLSVTYLVGAAASLLLYFILSPSPDLLNEYKSLNWAPFVLGLVVVGLEVGYIYAYRAGWPVSMAQIVQASLLAVVLLFVGWLVYKEVITWNKVLGIVICLIGLGILNK